MNVIEGSLYNKMISKEERKESRVVVVLGMHRSGTSVLTRALSALSINIGNDLMPATSDNPKGYFEDLEINRLNVELLEAMGCSWKSLLVPETPPGLSEKFGQRARTLVGERFAASSVWAFKDPRVTRVLPFWQRVLSEMGFHAVYILANRHPLAVADSLAKRDVMPRGQALGLWLTHQASGLQAILQNKGFVVDYDLMMQNPEAQLRRLSFFLGLHCESRELQTFTREFLDTDLRHSRYARDGSDLKKEGLENICRQLYSCISALAETSGNMPDASREGCFSVLRQCKDYLSANEDWFEAIDATEEEVLRLNNAIADRDAMIRRLEQRRLSARVRRFLGLQRRDRH